MTFLELFLTHIHIKMPPTTQNTHMSVYMDTEAYLPAEHTHIHTNTRTQSIPVEAVSTEDLIDCEAHKFQNSKVKHPLLKRRLDYFTGVSI